MSYELDRSHDRRHSDWISFGKQIQKRQLEIPEYAASFVDYKALKKLIKALSATPVLPAQNDPSRSNILEPREALQANKATFFFRLERELEKVNKFYLQKEAELKLRLGSLLDQKRSMQAQQTPASRLSSRYIALEEGFRQFSRDLSKLQQFIEINATAFSKILKKWDKASKDETKVVFLSRAVEVQPCFNPDVISNLSDQATTNLLDFAAWAEGEKIQFTAPDLDDNAKRSVSQENAELDSQIHQAVTAGNLSVVEDWTTRIHTLPDASLRVTRVFLGTADDASEQSLELLLNTGLVDLHEIDEINHRNILHKAAITGRLILLRIGLEGKVDVRAVDVYGRIPLHYACMHGSVDMIQELIAASPKTLEFQDHDKFTPLIHAIVHERRECVTSLLSHGAKIDPASDQDHVPLNLACQHGSSTIVKELLKHSPEIIPDAEGLYPQHLVARSPKAPQLLLMLKEYGADLDQPDKLYQWTPLFHASSEGNVSCLETLMESGVNCSILDEKGLSALYYAAWEGHLRCIRLLIEANVPSPAISSQKSPPAPPKLNFPPPASPSPMSRIEESIPPLVLPPAIVPIRRYGHNFLDSKTFVVLNFGTFGQDAIQFYDDNKYPAARITVSSKSSDLIPRNLLLPIQDDSKILSFQIDNLETFSIEFDVYATFGARVIARAVASSKVFTAQSGSSGEWHLELLDPRLRAVGRISFSFLVIKPFTGIPLEISHFSTYWRATAQDLQAQATSPQITGSSLSGQYVRLFIQLTCDKIPVLYPLWTVNHHGLQVPIMRLTWDQFCDIGAEHPQRHDAEAAMAELAKHPEKANNSANLATMHKLLASSFGSLQDVLSMLPPQVHVDLHILYPTREQEDRERIGPSPTMNDFADALLKVVFDHARETRKAEHPFVRGVVFSSYNAEICTALNWKQPNYPVLLCNDLGADAAAHKTVVPCSGRIVFSVQEAVSLARNNNFMGLACRSRILTLAPSLVETIKAAGLVLISDISGSPADSGDPPRGSSHATLLEKVDGTVRSNGILRFMDSVDE
ncbi:ankyrin repeat protein nuc-2 [Microthyrium microscopicum]|uniref:Ankyrin repeat protein nuc-2 n=1 Tax=Microthyrium microscopicum TaxID=703497 RepID=A0A6A6UMS6_9PEZI|nr:ankyrin repeat protein nuc-2 [Microthyrium microscopicum]